MHMYCRPAAGRQQQQRTMRWAAAPGRVMGSRGSVANNVGGRLRMNGDGWIYSLG